MAMLSSKNNDTIVLDVKTVTHNSQKRKLVLLVRSFRSQNLIQSYRYLGMFRLVSKNRYLVSKTVTVSYSNSPISVLKKKNRIDSSLINRRKKNDGIKLQQKEKMS